MTLAEFHERVCEPPLAQVRKKGALPLCCCVLTFQAVGFNTNPIVAQIVQKLLLEVDQVPIASLRVPDLECDCRSLQSLRGI